MRPEKEVLQNLGQAPPNDSTLWRLFIALRFPEDLKKNCGRLMTSLRTGIQFSGAHPVWVKAESLHLTLAFLGSTPVSKINEIEHIMRAAGKGMAPLSLRVGGLSLFPTVKNPRVIALHLHGDLIGLQRVHESLTVRLAEAGYPTDSRPFRPHVTLARIKSMRGLAGLRDVVWGHRDADMGKFVAKSLTLYRSHLLPSGAEYEIILETTLS
ncbi:MAG: RNA 2',3'-cyclic phosphodiesterase [Candidatus Sumerlaeaceae bacterium]